LFREATTAPKHKHADDSDNVTISEPKRGNSKAYTLDRLHREEPKLYQQGRSARIWNGAMTMGTNEALDWKQTARMLAGIANGALVSHRRGVFFVPVIDKLCVFNNNPYSNDATATDREIEELRERLKAAGIFELAYGEYPERGAEEGYSWAMLLDAGDEKGEFVEEQLHDITLDPAKDIHRRRYGLL
jgi:hypothetical protein